MQTHGMFHPTFFLLIEDFRSAPYMRFDLLQSAAYMLLNRTLWPEQIRIRCDEHVMHFPH